MAVHKRIVQLVLTKQAWERALTDLRPQHGDQRVVRNKGLM